MATVKTLVHKFDGPAQPINRMFDSKSLRDFLDMQKRHTIMRGIAPTFNKKQGSEA